MQKLDKSFFDRHVVEVAKDLLGKRLVFGEFAGIITETEAYRGSDDEASHAYAGPTARSSIMFGEPGHVYVYVIYGMYHCLNFVTEERGQPSAVLIRGLKLDAVHLDGPGKLCRHLGITKEHNGLDITSSASFYLLDDCRIVNYQTTPRIGIRKAKDKLWRFVISPDFLAAC